MQQKIFKRRVAVSGRETLVRPLQGKASLWPQNPIGISRVRRRSSKIRLLVCKEIYPAVGVRQFVGFDDKLTDAASITLLSIFLLRAYFFCKIGSRGVGRPTLATQH